LRTRRNYFDIVLDKPVAGVLKSARFNCLIKNYTAYRNFGIFSEFLADLPIFRPRAK